VCTAHGHKIGIENLLRLAAMAVACGQLFTLVATEDGDMYTFGMCRTFAQYTHDTFEPRLMDHLTSFGGEEVAMVAAFGENGAVVTKQGSLWNWGPDYGTGRVGSGIGRIGSDFFGSGVVMVACGSKSSIVLTSGGRVWTCGKNDSFTTQAMILNEFRLVGPERFNGRKIVMVASGGMHKMAVDEDGILWTWGDNFMGELCWLPDSIVGGSTAPHPIAIASAKFDGEKVVHVAGGVRYTMVVTENGTLWACGLGRNGEMGIGTAQQTNVLIRVGGRDIFGGRGVRMTSCGCTHTLIVGTDGRVWACGSAYHFALGTGDMFQSYPTTDCYVPTLLPDTDSFTNGNVMTVSAGGKHSVAVMYDGTVYTWGRYEFYAEDFYGIQTAQVVGTGHHTNKRVPTRLNPTLFNRARIGHWHKRSWLDAHQEHALAAAMGTHPRLGEHSALSSTPSDIIQRCLDEDMRFKPRYSAGLLALMGLGGTPPHAHTP